MNYQPLTMGIELPSPTPEEEAARIATLRATVEHYLPDFAERIRSYSPTAENPPATGLVFHQDAFAAGYDTDEYTLLGMFVKYAGLFGIEIHVIGENHATFGSGRSRPASP